MNSCLMQHMQHMQINIFLRDHTQVEPDHCKNCNLSYKSHADETAPVITVKSVAAQTNP